MNPLKILKVNFFKIAKTVKITLYAHALIKAFIQASNKLKKVMKKVTTANTKLVYGTVSLNNTHCKY